MNRFAIKISLFGFLSVLGGFLFFWNVAFAAYIGTQTVTDKSMGGDLKVSDFNSVLDITKKMFADDAGNAALYLGPLADPSGASCAVGYTHYDFNEDTVVDNGECWDGMVVDEVGNVGIGIAAPTEKLDVDGNIKLSGNFVDGFVTGGISLGQITTGTALSGFTATSIVGGLNELRSDTTTNADNIDTNAVNITDIYSTLSGNLNTISGLASAGVVQTDGSGDVTTSMTLQNGILATTQIAGDNSTSVATTAYVDTAMTGISSDQIIEGNTKVETIDTGVDGHIIFETEGSEAMRIDENGNVGIGTTGPTSALHIIYDGGGGPGGFDDNLRLEGSAPMLSFIDTNSGDNFIGSEGSNLYFRDGTGYTMTIGSSISILRSARINSNAANTTGILTLENTAGDIQLFRIDATPESSVTGSIGDLAIDGTGGEMYVKNSGDVTNTGWEEIAFVSDLPSDSFTEWTGTTANNTQTEIFIDGGATRETITASSVKGFEIHVVARDNTAGEVAMYLFKGVIKRDGINNTILVSPVIKEVLGEEDASWDVTVEADDTNEALVIKVTGDATNAVGWAAKGTFVEYVF